MQPLSAGKCQIRYSGRIPAPAFTLVEVIVTIGVILVLVGIWLPAISGAWVAAQNTRSASVINQGGVVLQLYQNDWRSYPLRSDTAINSTHQWAVLAAETGYVQIAGQLDPGLREADRAPTVHMSMCIAVQAALLSPVPTPPGDIASFAVRDDMIAFPSGRGVLLRAYVDPTVENPVTFCCGSPAPTMPVAFADGSVALGTWRDFMLDDTLDIAGGIFGIPVYSTWGGYLSRDR